MLRYFSIPIIALLFSLSSCNKETSEPKGNRSVLTLNLTREPPTLDPRKNGDLIGTCAHFILFEGLTHLNSDSSITPAQAERIEISDDLLTYTFHLRDAQWSNGTPVTAYDFEKSWRDVLDPAFPSINAHLFYPIKNAEEVKTGKLPLSELGFSAVDEKTFVVHLERPTPYFLQLIAFCPFFPVSKEIDEADPKWFLSMNENFVCNGPYMLKKWKHNDEMIVERNPKYWNDEQTKTDEIHLLMIANEVTALQMYEEGSLDVIGAPAGRVPAEAIPTLVKRGDLNIYDCAGIINCIFNTREYPFNNKNLRKAFSYAIDRQAIVENITLLGEQPATAIIGPVMKNNQNISLFRDHDVENARKHLELALSELEITANDLKNITFLYNSSDYNHRIAQALQQQWLEALGVSVKIECTDPKTLLDTMVRKAFTFCLNLWISQYPDAMSIFERFKYAHNAKNYPGWENEEYIALLDQSFYDSTPEKRAQTLDRAEQLFLEEMPLAPIFHMRYSSIVNPRVKDLDTNPIGVPFYSKIKTENSNTM